MYKHRGDKHRGDMYHRRTVCMKFVWLYFKIFQQATWKWWNSRKKVIVASTITQGMTASLIYNRASLRVSQRRIVVMCLSVQEFHAADTSMATVVLKQINMEHQTSTLLIEKFKKQKVKFCYFCRGLLHTYPGIALLGNAAPHSFCLMWFVAVIARNRVQLSKKFRRKV